MARRNLINSKTKAAQWLLFILLFISVPVTVAGTELFDSSRLAPKAPAAETLRRLENDSKLHYKEVFVVRRNWIDEFLRYLLEKLGSRVSESQLDRTIDIIKWGLVIFGIGAILYFLFRDEINRAFYTRRKLGSGVSSISENELRNDNLEALIQQLISEKNYSLALRYMYIRALQLLHEKGFIRWTREKTNTELVSELGRHTDPNAFKSLGKLFEYVHYGNFEASETVGKRAMTDLQQIKEQSSQ